MDNTIGVVHIHADPTEEEGHENKATPSPAPAPAPAPEPAVSFIEALTPAPAPEPASLYPTIAQSASVTSIVPTLASLPPPSDATIRPVRMISEATPRGFLTEPKLVDVVPTHDVAQYDAAWWASKSPEECMRLLVDAQSGIGVADLRNWTPLQTSRLVDLVEPKHLPVILRKINGSKYGWDNTPGVNIAFRNLGYTKNGVKRLIDLNGYFRAGSTCAVVGAPDAGISTFFDVLCKRDKGGVVTGDVVVNGLPRDNSFNRMVSYVMKDDVHIPLLTVRETLTFSAKQRAAPADNNDQFIKLRVDLNIKLLGLRGCANTIIGNGELRGISGGERRRVTVGCEMVSGTPVVVMDLPTNGLDSATAFDIMNSLKQQSLGGRSFICSLAQPSPELLRLFDTLLVLSKGAVIYFGPRREVVKYFAQLGFHCPADKPVPEFLEELSAIPHFYYTKPVPGAPVKESASFDDFKEGEVRASLPPVAATPKSVLPEPTITIEQAWQILVDGYKHSVTYENVRREVAREFEPKSDKIVAAARANNYQYNTNLLQQARLCVKRQFTELFRNRAGIQALISAQIIIALMLGSLFWQLGNSQDDARTRFGLVFFSLTFASSVASQLIPPFILLRPVFYLQQHAGYYRSAAYWMGRFFVNIPVGAVETMLFSLIVYSMSGLHGTVIVGSHFWFWWLTMYLVNLTAKGFATTIAAFGKTEAIAMGIAPVFLVLFMIFSGFMVPYDSMPIGWKWIYWCSFISYAIKALLINEIMPLTWSCNESEALVPGVIDACQFTDGHSALQLYSMDADDESYKWTLLGYVACFMVGWNFLALCSICTWDWSNTDSAESPNWEAGTKKIVVQDEGDAAVAAALKPEPAFIQWNNLSYSVVLPRSAKIGAAAAKKEAEAKAKMSAEAKSNGQVEMVEVKVKPAGDDEEQTPDAPGTKTLLQDCYGYAKPGMMVALMGGSGAGKTTLLDVLAGKKTGGTITNGPLINGKPRDLSFNRIAGYVEQFDSHDETATVREAIAFSAMLRLPKEMSYEMKMNKVDTVIQTLRLGHVQDQQIGSVIRGGISPELRKKVTIGVELVMDPGMLFLDEPTTGLDSAGALAVMLAVRKLSDKISVICTIHQPSIEIVNCFTHVLLLNKWRERGRVAYFGPLDGMAPYFAQAGLGNFVDGTNLAEFGLESLKQAERRGVNAAKKFLESPQGQKATSDLAAGVMTGDAAPHREYTLYAAGFWTQVWQTTVRSYYNNLRDIPTISGRMGLAVIISLLVGTLYWQTSFSQMGAQNRVSLMYMAVTIPAMKSMSKVPGLIRDRLLYFREKNSAMYSPFAYYVGRTLGDQPFVVFESFIYTLLLYWIAGMRSDDNGSKYGLFLLCFFMVRTTGLSFVELFAGFAPTGESAVSGCSSSFVMFQLFTGFLIRRTAIPRGWIWMHYLSFFKYPVYFLVSNELTGETFNCQDNAGAVSLPYDASVNVASMIADGGGKLYCTGNDGGNATWPCWACPIISGENMIEAFDMPETYSDRALMLGCVAIFMVGYRVLAYLSLRYVNHITK